MDYIVSTPCGQLRGCAGKYPGTVAYKGIRYATAGRWEYPKQVTGWEGVYDATAYGNASYQPRTFYNEEENLKKIFYYNEFRKGETYSYSEDCLFLNIFVPASAKEGDKLPVLFYIHGGGCFPCLDGEFVVGTGFDLLAAKKQKQISYMTGVTSEDMMPPILFGMAKDWCTAQENPSYLWYFDRQLPGDKNGAWHSSDLWYWFGALDNCWRPLTDKDRALSDEMTSYLCNYAKTGDPNGEGLTRWESCTVENKKSLRLGEKDTHMGNPGKLKMIWTMLTNKAVGE